MKKALGLLFTCVLLAGCSGAIGNDGNDFSKETYTMKENDYLEVNKEDSYTTKEFYNRNYYRQYASDSYGIMKGNFTIKLTYWEMGLDVKITGVPDTTELLFSYRGNISYNLIVIK